MPEKDHRIRDDMHLHDGEWEELYMEAGKCAEAGRVLKRIRELCRDDEDVPNSRADTPASAAGTARTIGGCQGPGTDSPNDERSPLDERQGR